MFASKRRVAHYILKQLLEDTIKQIGDNYTYDSDGRIQVERNGQTYYYAHSEVRIIYLIELNKFSRNKILSAIRLLASNGHIEYLGQLGGLGFDHTLIKSTPTGVKAFSDNYYKRAANYERNTFILGVLALLASIILGLLQIKCSK